MQRINGVKLIDHLQGVVEAWFVPLLLLLNLCLRVVYVLFATDYARYVYSDMHVYDSTAMGIIGEVSGAYHTYWAPGFSWFLAIIYKALQLLGILEHRLPITLTILAVIGTAGVWFMYKVSLFVVSKGQARVVLLLLCLWYPFIYLNTYLLSENLFIPLLFGGLYLLLFAQPRFPQFGFTGAILGAAFVVRTIIAPVLVLQALWIWLAKGSIRGTISYGLSVLGVLVIAVGVNSLFSNGEVVGLSEGGGVVFTLAWCDIQGISDGDYTIYPPVNGRFFAEETFFYGEKPFSEQSYYYQKGLACLWQNPARLVTNLGNIGNMFHSVLFPLDLSAAFVEPLMTIYKLANFLMLGMTVMAVWFALKLKRKQEERGVVLLLASVLIGVAAAVYLQNPGEERYLIPFSPILLILTIWGATQLGEWWRKRKSTKG